MLKNKSHLRVEVFDVDSSNCDSLGYNIMYSIKRIPTFWKEVQKLVRLMRQVEPDKIREIVPHTIYFQP